MLFLHYAQLCLSIYRHFTVARRCYASNPICKSPDDQTVAFNSQQLIDLNRLICNLSAINSHNCVMSQNQFTLFLVKIFEEIILCEKLIHWTCVYHFNIDGTVAVLLIEILIVFLLPGGKNEHSVQL